MSDVKRHSLLSSCKILLVFGVCSMWMILVTFSKVKLLETSTFLLAVECRLVKLPDCMHFIDNEKNYLPESWCPFLYP